MHVQPYVSHTTSREIININEEQHIYMKKSRDRVNNMMIVISQSTGNDINNCRNTPTHNNNYKSHKSKYTHTLVSTVLRQHQPMLKRSQEDFHTQTNKPNTKCHTRPESSM
jgi:hypothetical protein